MLPKPARAFVLTALSLECQAVLAHVTRLRRERHPSGTVYEIAAYAAANGTSWQIAIAEIGAGNIRAAVECERAISYFKPSVVMFVGIAGGLKDVQLGDVVAADKVYFFHAGKEGDIFFPRPDPARCSHRMVQTARAVIRDAVWPLTCNPHTFVPKAIVGPIAAGENVVSSTNSPAYQKLKAFYSDAVAVEMEGRGFLEPAFSAPEVDSIVVRGISDLIDNKEKADATGWQPIAADRASAFALALLSEFVLEHAPSTLWSLTIDEVPQGDIERLVARLKEVLGDPHIQLRAIERGSVNLIIESSPATFERAAVLSQQKFFSNVLGARVRNVKPHATGDQSTHTRRSVEVPPTQLNKPDFEGHGSLVDAAGAESEFLTVVLVESLKMILEEGAKQVRVRIGGFDLDYDASYDEMMRAARAVPNVGPAVLAELHALGRRYEQRELLKTTLLQELPQHRSVIDRAMIEAKLRSLQEELDEIRHHSVQLLEQHAGLSVIPNP